MATTSAPPRVDAVTTRRFTVDEYYRMAAAGILSEDDRVELIEGEIVQLRPIGSRHAECVDRLFRYFSRALADQAHARGQNPIRIEPDSEPEPDIAVVRARSYAHAHPGVGDVLLIIEVSDTTLRYDTETKVPLYARAAIPEVWIVAIDFEHILRFTEPREDGYRIVETFRSDEVITSTAVPGATITVALAELFAVE